MYAMHTRNEQERLVGEEDTELAMDMQSDREQTQQIQICRAVRHGLLAVAVFGVLGLACVHFSGEKALKSSLEGTQVKAGLYGNGAFGAELQQQQAQPAAPPPAPAVADATPAVPAVPAAPAVAPVAPAADSSNEHAVINTDINSVNDLSGGTGEAQVVSGEAANNPLAPKENLADGNECAHDEEEFEGLCYKKCSILTDGAMGKRVSAFECSTAEGFMGVFKGKTEGFPIPCTGYGVAGDEAGGGCPHKNGACLRDEEIYLGMCFKTCAMLTNNLYTVRTGAESCCNSENMFECMNPIHSKFDPDYNIGGGVSNKESKPHDPEVKLTEAR